MSSDLRSRSVSRSRITKISSEATSGEVLDPAALLEDLLSKIPNLDAPLGVTLTSGTDSVTYLLSTFLSKEYEIREGLVIFGIKKLQLKGLRARISFEVEVSES